MHRTGDFLDRYNICVDTFCKAIRYRLERELDCRKRWPMYCSYKEDALFRNPEFDVLPLLGASISALLFVFLLLHLLFFSFSCSVMSVALWDALLGMRAVVLLNRALLWLRCAAASSFLVLYTIIAWRSRCGSVVDQYYIGILGQSET